MDQVHECMTPVFIHAERMGNSVIFDFDIPPEAPTVRGFAAVLKQGLTGCTAEQIVAVPPDFYRGMGLHSVLSAQRLNGIGAILAHMQTLAANLN